MGCHVCGKPFKNFPEHLVVISNGNDATAMLHVQLSVKVKKSDDCTEPLPDYACAPICIPCVHMIVSGAFRGLAAKAALENPEQN
jgi:hypothetical protein